MAGPVLGCGGEFRQDDEHPMTEWQNTTESSHQEGQECSPMQKEGEQRHSRQRVGELRRKEKVSSKEGVEAAVKVPLRTCRGHPLCCLELSSLLLGVVATSSPEGHDRYQNVRMSCTL